ncbi:hypothetical protein BH23ACT9_BH23ACT9_28480 [soil metagenome]
MWAAEAQGRPAGTPPPMPLDDVAVFTIDGRTGTWGDVVAHASDVGAWEAAAVATEAPTTASAITAGPPCAPNSSCSAALLVDGRSCYEVSCGLVDPTLVTEEIYAVGEGITAHTRTQPGVVPRIAPRCRPCPGLHHLAPTSTCPPRLNGSDDPIPADGPDL